MNIYSTIYSTFHLYNPLNNIIVANIKYICLMYIANDMRGFVSEGRGYLVGINEAQ